MAIKGAATYRTYYALDTGNTTYKTGDSANHTLKVVADDTEGSVAASPTEVDSTNCPGLYLVLVAAGENSGNSMTLHGKSATADVVIIPVNWENVVNLTHIAGVAVSTTTAQLGVNVASLSNDVITSAKFDETTAFPLKAADSGSTYIARTGADSDTLETLSDQIDDTCTLGTGASANTYTVVDGDSNPLDGVAVWVTTDVGGSNTVASGTTNSSGQVTFYLDAGTTYYIWRQLAGYNFTNPDTEVAA